MDSFVSMLALLGVGGAIVGGVYVAGAALAVVRRPLEVSPFLSGYPPSEHAVSRYHVRWYAVTMLFLAFDMEMVFMYPWVLVVAAKGTSAVVEMFTFLAILMAGALYAWREGALRWT